MMMRVMSKTKMGVALTGKMLNEVVSFIVFSVLDLLDFILCYVYKVVDFLVEAEWKPCYCSPAKDEAITSSGKIMVSEQDAAGESKRVVCTLPTGTATNNKLLHLEEISDTLYTRTSLVSDVSKSTVSQLNKRLSYSAHRHTTMTIIRSCFDRVKIKRTVRTTFTATVSSTVVEMLQGKIGGQQSHPIPRWSDCDCKTCTEWTASQNTTTDLFVKADGAISAYKENEGEDVLFIHGFISSSAFWTETLFPNFSKEAKSKYRLFAVDLLGFGRSPKPTDSLYTIREHIEMIERSVLEPRKVKSFHIVAHSLGCILAFALAVKYPLSVKSLTLLAPPYFPTPKGEQATQYMMRKVAPRRVWPAIAFGASLACWYEHISRTICLLICKQHRVWEFLTKLLTRNRMKTYLIEGFCCHTHNAAWHTLHNIICGTAGRIESYLDVVRNNLNCDINIFHGRNDECIPVECSYNVKSRIPRARVKVVENEDHLTIVINRQKTFAKELEIIWKNASVSG